ncbi:MAG TPA: hypothetical protein V6D15_12310 [Oculatellaceae cyanobacterium]|jgi:hypothetical protein
MKLSPDLVVLSGAESATGRITADGIDWVIAPFYRSRGDKCDRFFVGFRRSRNYFING